MQTTTKDPRWFLITVAIGLLLGCQDQADEMATTDVAIGDTITAPPGPVNPGRVVWRRLNRTEYDNTVRDLLNTAQRPARDFPADDTGFGFDNIASVLTLSPLHLELYERAADALADEALTMPLAEPLDLAADPAQIQIDPEGNGRVRDSGDVALWSPGIAFVSISVPVDGTYTVYADVWAQQAGPELARVALWVDGLVILSQDVVATQSDQADTLTLPVTLAAGNHVVGVEFLNDFYDPDAGLDRNLFVARFGLTGPADLPPVTEAPWWRVVVCQDGDLPPRECAEENVSTFAARAWRRPPADDAVSSLMALWDDATADGLAPLDALKLPIKAILLAPQFIFKTEFNTQPASADAENLDGWAIASRLSYLIWSSMPDDALFAAAADGSLDTSEGIDAQVRRMLQDPKASALVDDFGGQWLFIRGIDNSFPDLSLFPDWNEALRMSMREEMRRFFESFITEDRSLLELLHSDEAFVDSRLAAHYGVDVQIPAGEFRRVSMAGTPRRGLLGQAGLMTTLSTPFRTSIVRRGKWVLGQLLCSEPPPPPPGVEARIDEELPGEPKTLRQRMEAHLGDPTCRECHQSMDPIGYALEPFDAIGGWRELDNGVVIDATGELPDGRTFDGPLELSAVLAADDKLVACITEQLMTYALGRGLLRADGQTVDAIADELAARGTRFEELLVLVATSAPFRQRTGEPAVEAP